MAPFNFFSPGTNTVTALYWFWVGKQWAERGMLMAVLLAGDFASLAAGGQETGQAAPYYKITFIESFT